MTRRKGSTLDRRARKRLCPECGGELKFQHVGMDFKVYLTCLTCGEVTTGANAKVVDE